MGLDTRSVNILETAGIIRVRELSSKSRDELLQIQNFGSDSLRACRALLDQLLVAHPSWKSPPKKKKKKGKK